MLDAVVSQRGSTAATMERHSTDYSRFDAIDADASLASPYDGGFKADLTWHNSRTTSFVFIAVDASLFTPHVRKERMLRTSSSPSDEEHRVRI